MSETAVRTDAMTYVPTTKDFCLKNSARELAIDTNFAAQSLWREAFIRFVREKGTMVGLILIVLIVVLTAVGPRMNTYSYSAQNITQKNFTPCVLGLEQFGVPNGSKIVLMTSGSKKVNSYREKKPDNVRYWFGSGNFGRDLWTKTWPGARASLMIAVVAVMIDMLIGMSYNLTSGYFGGRVDIIVQRILETSNGIPQLVTVAFLLLILKSGMLIIIFVLISTEWIGMSRTARAEVLKLKEQEFVLTSRILGTGPFFIILKEILPNIIGPIIARIMFSIPTAILTEAFFSFVGLGIPAPECSLGSLISGGLSSFTTHSFQIFPPITAVVLLVLSFNLVDDGSRGALDPRLKEM